MTWYIFMQSLEIFQSNEFATEVFLHTSYFFILWRSVKSSYLDILKTHTDSSMSLKFNNILDFNLSVKYVNTWKKSEKWNNIVRSGLSCPNWRNMWICNPQRTWKKIAKCPWTGMSSSFLTWQRFSWFFSCYIQFKRKVFQNAGMWQETRVGSLHPKFIIFVSSRNTLNNKLPHQ